MLFFRLVVVMFYTVFDKTGLSFAEVLNFASELQAGVLGFV